MAYPAAFLRSFKIPPFGTCVHRTGFLAAAVRLAVASVEQCQTVGQGSRRNVKTKNPDLALCARMPIFVNTEGGRPRKPASSSFLYPFPGRKKSRTCDDNSLSCFFKSPSRDGKSPSRDVYCCEEYYERLKMLMLKVVRQDLFEGFARPLPPSAPQQRPGSCRVLPFRRRPLRANRAVRP